MRQLACLALAALGLVLAAAANANDCTAGNLLIARPWARASVASNGVVYLIIANNGQKADRLTAVSTPMAKSAELHTTHEMENGVMDMAPLADVEIKQGAPAVFTPGGNHVMLIGLAHPLKQGERFPMTLTFEDAGQVTVDVPVEAVGALAPMSPAPMSAPPMSPVAGAPAGESSQGQMPMGSGTVSGMQHAPQPSQ
ncbi:MAG TPA: copper chaperone PCu(A)C [Alphaproteobacteria bacterium]